ncbi:MAG: DUF5777 family beta-barrel protein [Bacteroidia bacterium]|nr:DUF5777 family beta-barrel protein [Bacteroidia bacterium]
MRTARNLFFALLLVFSPVWTFAQEDLMDLLDDMDGETTNYAFATFKTVRIVNAHSIELPAAGVLQLIISHRFGRINDGAYQFFGLDQANMRLGFEYGVTRWLNVGVGRSNVNKTYDSFVKVKFFRQSSGKRVMPFSVVGVSGIQANTLYWADPDRVNYFSSRLSFSHQLLIARKFNENLSLQLMPTMIHRNLVATRAEDNDVFSVGAGGRIKITPSMSINVEYFYILDIPGYSHTANNFENSLSLSFDIETGGHVFQLMFTNSRGMTENLFVAETVGDWGNGDIYFGFNLARVFTVSDKREKVKK